MVNSPMVSQWFPGGTASSWCRMLPALIPLHPLIAFLPLQLVKADAVAAQAEVRKYSKYCHLDSSYTFVPVAIEASVAMEPRSTEFLRELEYCLIIRQATGEVKASTYLLQCLLVAIQRGNSASVPGTISLSDALRTPLICYYHYYFFFFFLIF